MDKDGNVIGVVNSKGAVQADKMQKVLEMPFGAISLHGMDLVEVYKVLINNFQLGIGYAVPASYIPEHKEMSISPPKVVTGELGNMAEKSKQKNGKDTK